MELVVLFEIVALLFGPRRGGRHAQSHRDDSGAVLLVWLLAAFGLGLWKALVGTLP